MPGRASGSLMDDDSWHRKHLALRIKNKAVLLIIHRRDGPARTLSTSMSKDV
jgi:hypothetical protein